MVYNNSEAPIYSTMLRQVPLYQKLPTTMQMHGRVHWHCAYDDSVGALVLKIIAFHNAKPLLLF